MEEKIKINDININYKIEGIKNKKTILFIHGLSDDLNYWNNLSQELKKDYKTLSYDLRGHGKTDLGNIDVNINTYEEDIYNLLNKLNIKEVVIISLSLGGNIALQFSLKHPEMVKGLILMSTFSQMNINLKNKFKLLEDSIEKDYLEFYDNIIQYCLPKDMLNKHKETLNKIKFEKAKTSNKKGILCGIKAGYNFSISSQLNKINTPVLILSGEKDDITPINLQKIIHKNIKNSKLITFPDTKHNILIKRNMEKINKLIKEFLDKNY